MRTAISFMLVLATALVLGTACGGGDDDSTDDPLNPSIDAGDPVLSPDANVSVAGQIGTACSGVVACPADVEACVSLVEAGATFCTKQCGHTDEQMPPASGNATCQEGYTGTATPACGLAMPAEGGGFDWYCGLACGMPGGMDFGTCPSNLTCDGATATDIGICQ
jgi:hypothetical protein